MGAAASVSGSDDAKPTCWAANSRTPMRRDYCIANASMVAIARVFEVLDRHAVDNDGADMLAVHQPIVATVDVNSLNRATDKFFTTTSAADLFDSTVTDQLKYEIDLHDPASDGRVPSENDVRCKLRIELHCLMDKHLHCKDNRIAQCIHLRDTSRLWALIISSIETAFIDFFELKCKEAAAMRGISDARIVAKCEQCRLDNDFVTSQVADKKVSAGLYTAHARRLGHLPK